MLIHFIQGKNIATKSLSDNTISAHFEVPVNFQPEQYINKPLQLLLDGGVVMDCSISTEWASYYYNGTHKTYAIKLDINLPAILAIGLIFDSKEIQLIY